MSNTIFKFLAALLLPAMLSAADDLLVADGAATADAVILRNSFRPEGGCLTGEGTGGLVSSLYLYRADDFQVTANLTLRELNRTAAGLRVNDKLWSLDNGGDGKLFFEDIGSSHGTPLLPAEQFIVPGKPFILKLTGKGGVMTFEIDGKTVGTANYDVNIPVEIALRPWRNRMEIRSLAITGRQAGLAAESKPTPVADTPVDILTGGTLPIMPGFNLPTGTWQAELRPVAAPQNGYRFELPLDSPDRLTLSPEACMAAYRRSGADALLAQPFELVMTAPEQNRRYSCRLVLFDSRKPADFPRASVSGKDGSCYFAFNGKECGTITSRLAIDNRALELSARSLRQFAAAGIPGQIVMVEPWKFVKNGVFDRQAFMKNLESSLCRLIVEAPDARFHLQLFLYMPPEWGAANPAECIKLDNGVQRLLNAPDQKLQPSYASPAWRSEMGNILRETVAGLRHSPFADRIA